MIGCCIVLMDPVLKDSLFGCWFESLALVWLGQHMHSIGVQVVLRISQAILFLALFYYSQSLFKRIKQHTFSPTYHFVAL